MELFEKGILSAKKAGYAFSLHAICYFAVAFVVSIFISALGSVGADFQLYLSYLVSPVAIVLSSLIFFKTTDTPTKEIAPLKFEIKYILIALLLAFGLMFSLGWVNEYTVKFLQLFGYQPREVGSYLPNLNGFNVIPALIIIALLPAVLEEFLFRGNVFANLENGVGTWRAILLSGFCFSIFHGNPEQTVYQFLTGCAYALLVSRAQSLLPAIIMHFINNATIIIFSACGGVDAVGNLTMPEQVYVILMVASLISLICAIALLLFDKKELIANKKGQLKGFFATASVAIILLSLTWITSLF